MILKGLESGHFFCFIIARGISRVMTDIKVVVSRIFLLFHVVRRSHEINELIEEKTARSHKSTQASQIYHYTQEERLIKT